MEKQNDKEHDDGHPQTGPMVTITVSTDGVDKVVNIHRGHRTITEIKAAAGVPIEYVIDQIVDGQIIPLQSDGGVTIKGDERFISHPDDGKAS
jgi:hypothetical protein